MSRTRTATDPEAAYYQNVEDYFVSLRGDPLFLSNADWNLVRRWRLAGIPLRVVLRGIKDALDAHALGWSRDRKVASLAYCAGEVEAARERWARALGRGGTTGIDAGPVLGRFAGLLEGAATLGPLATAAANAIAREMRGGAAPAGLAGLTAWLAEREAKLLKAIAAEEAEDRKRKREAEIADELRPWHERMPAGVLEQIRRESFARRTLEAYGLPRLSLFHLEGGGEGV